MRVLWLFFYPKHWKMSAIERRGWWRSCGFLWTSAVRPVFMSARGATSPWTGSLWPIATTAVKSWIGAITKTPKPSTPEKIFFEIGREFVGMHTLYNYSTYFITTRWNFRRNRAVHTKFTCVFPFCPEKQKWIHGNVRTALRLRKRGGRIRSQIPRWRAGHLYATDKDASDLSPDLQRRKLWSTPINCCHWC